MVPQFAMADPHHGLQRPPNKAMEMYTSSEGYKNISKALKMPRALLLGNGKYMAPLTVCHNLGDYQK